MREGRRGEVGRGPRVRDGDDAPDTIPQDPGIPGAKPPEEQPDEPPREPVESPPDSPHPDYDEEGRRAP